MVSAYLVGLLLAAQLTGNGTAVPGSAGGPGSGSVGVISVGGGVATSTTTATTVVLRTTTSTVVSNPTPPPTPAPTSPPAPNPTPVTTDPSPTPTAAPTPRATRPPSPAPSRAGTPPTEVPGPPDPAPTADLGDQAPEVGPDASSPPAPAGPPPIMRMDRPSSEPGGVVVLAGHGCAPGLPVAVAVADVAVGAIPGQDDGDFVAVLTLPDFGPGRYDIHVDCGTTFTIPIDVVVATSVDSPNSVLAVFIFFVLLALALYRRRRIPVRSGPGASPDPVL